MTDDRAEFLFESNVVKHLFALNRYFGKYKLRVGAGVLFVILSNAFRTYNPRMVGKAIDSVADFLRQATLPGNDLASSIIESNLGKQLFIFFCIYMGIALMEGLFTFLMRQTIIVVSRLIEFDLKNDIYSHYQDLDTAFYKRNNTGDLMNRITEDVSRVRMYAGPAIMYSVNLFFTIAFAVSAMLSINPKLTLYVLIPLPVLSFIIYYVNTLIEKVSTEIQAKLSDLTTQAQENYSGIRVVQAYHREENMAQHFEAESNLYKQKSLHLAKIDAIYFPAMNFLIGLSLIATIYFGGIQVGAGQLTPGNIAEFLIYMNMLMWPVSSLGWVASLIQRAAASMKRINEFMKVKPAIRNQTAEIRAQKSERRKLMKDEAIDHITLQGEVEFSNVSFVYPDTGIRALHNLSFKIPKGQRWAVIGRTGAGKTTIAELLMRMYDVSSGNILIDGKDVREWHLGSLRHQIGYVPQDVFLFSETVAENIAFGVKTFSQSDVEQFAKYASVDTEIERFQHGYKTMIGERGVTLSGGQKQRISIARALIKQPNMLILDDCLSAVDAATEKSIQQQLDEVLKSKTAIIITHRIFSLIHFDNIIVLENGTIAEQGTHEQLLQRKGIYAGLYAHQLEEEKSEVG